MGKISANKERGVRLKEVEILATLDNKFYCKMHGTFLGLIERKFTNMSDNVGTF